MAECVGFDTGAIRTNFCCGFDVTGTTQTIISPPKPKQRQKLYTFTYFKRKFVITSLHTQACQHQPDNFQRTFELL